MRREPYASEGAPPRFVADAMLGKLARWLRLLGYDTLYMNDTDAAIAYTARSESRVLLTRDRALARRRGLETVLVQSSSLQAQLVQVVEWAAAQSTGSPRCLPPRCMACNVPLEPVPRSVAAAHVPPYVARTHELFHRCPECGKIYWQGSHWRNMAHLLKDLRSTD